MELSRTLEKPSHGEYKWYFLLLVNILITTLLIACAKHGYLPITNHYIPDSTFYEDHVLKGIDRGLTNGFTQINSWLYEIGPQSFLFYNTILMLLSVYLCNLFQVFSQKAVAWARFMVVFNPYMLISVLGPSKECNLTFFSLLSIYVFINPKWSIKLFGLASSSLLILIRPQFGAILLVTFLLYPLLSLFKNTMLLCWLLLLTYFALNAIPAVNTFILDSQGGEELPFFKESSIYEVAIVLHLMSSHPILQFPAFFAKMCLVMITPIARPGSISSSYIPLLEWAYSFMSSTLLPLNFGFLLLFFSSKNAKRPLVDQRVQYLIIYTFAGVMSVIISPSVQFRYLFPYGPFLAACFTLHSVKTRNTVLLFSFGLTLLFFLLTTFFFQRQWGQDRGFPFFLSWL